MTSGSDDWTNELFRSVLGRSSVLLPFADAVARHLNRFRAARVARLVITAMESLDAEAG